MARTYDSSSVDIELRDEDVQNLTIESDVDIENISLPTDWNLESVEVFGSGAKAEWSRDDGGYAVISPYPYPNQSVHRVELSGRTKDIEGCEDAVKEVIDFIRENTADERYRVQGPEEYGIQYSSNLSQSFSVGRSNDPGGVIDIDCTQCGNDGLYLQQQTMETNMNMVEVEYICLCPSCSSEMVITDKNPQL